MKYTQNIRRSLYLSIISANRNGGFRPFPLRSRAKTAPELCAFFGKEAPFAGSYSWADQSALPLAAFFHSTRTRRRYFQVLAAFLLAGLIFSCNAQPVTAKQSGYHTDLEELGIKGKVRQVRIDNYMDVPTSLNEDSAYLFESDIFYLNRSGNLDSTLQLRRQEDGDSMSPSQKSTITSAGGIRRELIYYYAAGNIDTVQRKVLSDRSYLTRITNKQTGRVTQTTYFLDSDFVVYKLETLVLDSTGHQLLSQGSEQYDKDKRGLYRKSTFHFSDVDSDAVKKAAMTYQDFDGHHNPKRTILKHLDQPDKIELRVFHYKYY